MPPASHIPSADQPLPHVSYDPLYDLLQQVHLLPGPHTASPGPSSNNPRRNPTNMALPATRVRNKLLTAPPPSPFDVQPYLKTPLLTLHSPSLPTTMLPDENSQPPACLQEPLPSTHCPLPSPPQLPFSNPNTLAFPPTSMLHFRPPLETNQPLGRFQPPPAAAASKAAQALDAFQGPWQQQQPPPASPCAQMSANLVKISNIVFGCAPEALPPSMQRRLENLVLDVMLLEPNLPPHIREHGFNTPCSEAYPL